MKNSVGRGTINRIKRLALASAALLVVCSIPWQRATAGVLATGTLTVTANVVASATIGNATAAFGQYNRGANSDIQTNFDLTVSLNTPFTVYMDHGGHFNSGTGRQMASSPVDFLRYQLFLDSFTTQWGDSASGVGLTGTGDGTNHPQTIFARIPSGQNVPPGNYADSVTMTVEF